MRAVVHSLELTEVLVEWKSRLHRRGYLPIFCSVESKRGLDFLAFTLRDRTTFIGIYEFHCKVFTMIVLYLDKLPTYKDSKDGMSRGYFADMSDLKKHGGKTSKRAIFDSGAILELREPEVASFGVLLLELLKGTKPFVRFYNYLFKTPEEQSLTA